MAKTEMKPTKEEILAKHGYKCAIDVKDKDKFIEAFVNPLLEAMDEWAEIYHKEKMREELKAFLIWYVSPPAITLILQSNTDKDTILCEYLNTINTK